MSGLIQNLRRIVATLIRAPSPLRYSVTIPVGWNAFPAAGSRHYDEYRSPTERAAVRVFTYESSATTLEDMISQDLAGIRGHEGNMIDTQSALTLKNGTPAYRIAYSIKAAAASRYGVDVMAVVDQGSVLISLVSAEPVTPSLMDAFNGIIDSLQTPTANPTVPGDA